MNLPPKISMPGFIVVVLLAYFGLALFGKPLGIVVTTENSLVQTLINLTIAAASFFIGTTQGSAKKDDIIANSPPVVTPPSTTVTTTTSTSEEKTP